MAIEDYTYDELVAEAKRRKPQRLGHGTDWSLVITRCEDNISTLMLGDGPIKDIENLVFDAAMDAIYGRNEWDNWYNDRVEESGQ